MIQWQQTISAIGQWLWQYRHRPRPIFIFCCINGWPIQFYEHNSYNGRFPSKLSM